MSGDGTYFACRFLLIALGGSACYNGQEVIIMVRFGMPSLIETRTVEQSAAICRELGLEFVELNANFPQFQTKNLNPEELNRIARAYGISYTIHLDDDLNIADFNDYVADAYCRTARETIELAEKIGAPVLNMHMARGAVYTLPQRKVYFFGEYRTHYLDRIRAFRDMCQAWIGDSGISVCLENTGGFLDFHREAIDSLLESPVFSLTLDTGHNHCAQRVDEPWILERSDRLKHMHLHDALGKKDHLPLGEGELDADRFLSLAKEHDCSVVLETKTEEGLRRSVSWLRANG